MEIMQTLILSFVLAFFVGMERQLGKKPVGFAPYVFVTVLSTAITAVTVSVFQTNQVAVISGIITGIGFLGAGALIRYHEKVFGFTTAAAVWAMAVFGIVVAIAELQVIALAYAIIWATLIIDKIIEMRGLGRHMKTVSVEAKGIGSHSDIKEIIAEYRDTKEEGVEMNFDRGLVEYKFTVPKFVKIEEMVEELSKLKDMRKITVE